MSEPLRAKPEETDPAELRLRQGGPDSPLSEADRAARIEELLLSGLDQYFGGHYEQAINIWTRVAFLERGHGRARAYIERARRARREAARVRRTAALGRRRLSGWQSRQGTRA